MPDDVKTEEPKQEADTSGTTSSTTVKVETPGSTPAKVETTSVAADPKPDDAGKFTNAQVESIVTQRLERAKTSWEAEKTEAERRATLATEERLKLEKQELEGKLTQQQEKTLRAERTIALAGKVADPSMAIKLVTDEHLTPSGDVDVEKLLKAYPLLAPTNRKEPVTRANVADATAKSTSFFRAIQKESEQRNA